jgi:hypothetical protein
MDTYLSLALTSIGEQQPVFMEEIKLPSTPLNILVGNGPAGKRLIYVDEVIGTHLEDLVLDLPGNQNLLIAANAPGLNAGTLEGEYATFDLIIHANTCIKAANHCSLESNEGWTSEGVLLPEYLDQSDLMEIPLENSCAKLMRLGQNCRTLYSLDIQLRGWDVIENPEELPTYLRGISCNLSRFSFPGEWNGRTLRSKKYILVEFDNGKRYMFSPDRFDMATGAALTGVLHDWIKYSLHANASMQHAYERLRMYSGLM